MMTSQSLKYVDFTKTQKFRYIENETLFFLQIKKDQFMAKKNSLVVEVTFNKGKQKSGAIYFS